MDPLHGFSVCVTPETIRFHEQQSEATLKYQSVYGYTSVLNFRNLTSMPALLSEFLPFILALALGYSYKRLGILKREDGRVIARMVVNVTFPAVAFTALYRASLSADVLLLPVLGLCIPLGQMIIAYALGRRIHLPDAEMGVFL